MKIKHLESYSKGELKQLLQIFQEAMLEYLDKYSDTNNEYYAEKYKDTFELYECVRKKFEEYKKKELNQYD